MRQASGVAPFLLAAVAAFFSLAGEGRAHRVNVFAFVDGGEVQVECAFSRNSKVRNGRLVIVDAETEEVIAEGTTDERGMFRFRPSDGFLATGRGLTIRLFAGEGHRDEWTIAAEELRALARTPASAAEAPPAGGAPATPPRSDPPEKAGKETGKEARSLSAVDSERLEAIMGDVLDAKLAPLKQALVRLEGEQDAPGLRDIVGGLGWILGLLGAAAYMKYRRQ